MTETSQINVHFHDDPKSTKEARASSHAAEWESVLADELKSIKDLGVYKPILRSSMPIGQKILKGMPVLKLKCNVLGMPIRFTCCWVALGYHAVYDQDYTATTSPIAYIESFRVLLHLGASLDWDIEQIDIKTAFLHGLRSPDKICYMQQPPGLEEPSKVNWVWEL